MTIKEEMNFYEQAQKQYKIENNLEFQNWYHNQILLYNYQPCIMLEEIDELIENIKTWYEIKYPNRIFEMKQYQNEELAYIEDISRYLDFEQLILRVSSSGRQVLKTRYRSETLWTQNSKTYIVINIQKEGLGEFHILTNGLGIVEKYHLHELEEFLPPSKGSTTLRRILFELKKSSPKDLDYTELETCIKRYEIDLELKDKVIALAALSLLYSKNTTPEYGYSRAYSLIKEYNDYYIRNLSLKDIDTRIEKTIIPKRRNLSKEKRDY